MESNINQSQERIFVKESVAFNFQIRPDNISQKGKLVKLSRLPTSIIVKQRSLRTFLRTEF